MTYQQRITHFLGQSIGSLLKVFKWHPKKQKSNLTLLVESSKTLPKTPSLDSPSEIEWDIEEMKRAYIDAAEQSWDEFSGG
jgi:hypothetical protein